MNTKTFSPDTPVTDLAGVGEAYTERLARLGIMTVNDLLHYFPRRYDDLTKVWHVEDVSKFGEMPAGERVTVEAEVLGTETRRLRGRRSMLKANIGSTKGFMEAVWFNQPYVAKQLRIGETYRFSGVLKTGYGRPSLQQPAFERAAATNTHTARLVPVYPETEGVTSKWLRDRIKDLLPAASQLTESLPSEVLQAQNLLSITEAIPQIHFPDSPGLADRARYRFDFEQIFVRQLLTVRSRERWLEGKEAIRVPYDAERTKRFVGSLPWPLTDDQRRAAHEILTDLDSQRPMLRLLQGDVGSGKTAVAAIALHQAATAGFQGALMAPTETLARQHTATLARWFKPHNIPVAALLGSQPDAEKRQIKESIAKGDVSIIVGTHALIQETVEWQNLAVAVVDEQHRFGVAQRGAIGGNTTPHLLTMTATPIPRSLALVAFGDQALSIIRARPAGRQPIVTEVVSSTQRERAFAALRRELDAGRQAFIVYPVIADSILGLRGAEEEYARLQKTLLSDYQLGLLHGRLPATEKTAAMDAFAAGELDVLVATSVIEVGVDVPNATVMLIEEAQQFGLAQLHQFRGRVGRGAHQSYCFLLSGDVSKEDNERLAAMVKSNSGFDLAEVDLKLRGPGDLLGTKQSGFEVSLAGLSNPELVKAAHETAEQLIAKDPELTNAPLLAARLADVVTPA